MASLLSRFNLSLKTVAATAALTVAGLAIAGNPGVRPDHPDTYVVKKGDTLWDIAGKFLSRPWLWPEIWQANPQVKNPHLIYPGDVLSLAYINRTAEARQPAEAPIPGIPLAQVEPWLKDMRVVDSFDQLPYVVGLEEDRLRGSQGYVVYAKGLPASAVGQRFLIVRPNVRYARLDRRQGGDIMDTADLDFRGKRTIDFDQFWTSAITPDRGHDLLGYELQRVNIGTVTRGEVGGIEASTIRLDEAGREVREGDRLIPVDAQSYDPYFVPHPPKAQFEYRHAQVLAVADRLRTAGPRDVIAISVGSRDGVDNGTVFSLWRMGSNKVDRVKYQRSEELVGNYGRVRLPDEFSGHAMVFRTFDHVSYALVMDGIKPTEVGYELKHPDAPY
ncbi:MAG: LysM peptidoglycan-binding domain-containing protein [Proteobacteria bacterium]|nr:LysM peptidoglycan-binding domain-containing protein [Pseudomonadota bacterium]